MGAGPTGDDPGPHLARSALPPRALLPEAILASADPGAGPQLLLDRVVTRHPAALPTADRCRNPRRRQRRLARDCAAVRGDHGGRVRAEHLERAALHTRLGRHPLRHAADALPPSAAAFAAVLRLHAVRRHHVAAKHRHRRDPADSGGGGAGLGRERAVSGRHGRLAGVSRCPAVPARHRAVAGQRVGAGALSAQVGRACRDTARAQRRHRELPDRDSAGGEAGRHR